MIYQKNRNTLESIEDNLRPKKDLPHLNPNYDLS